MNHDNELIEIAIKVKHRTKMAMLVTDGETECWIPLSQIEDYTGREDFPTTIFIPEWLAIEKELV